ncbi:negative elongation factor B-like [Liolophura sinensis]|uniref:negative elongation factor B-like n=1 Tax=Liolophura sinensis TaxID=3198878 RepID=UPI0031596B54
MSGLDALGIPGGDFLREALTNCSDPLAAIEEFQHENGILLPSLKPALPFLDLHGVKRLDFHQSVMEELREKLLQRITDLASKDDPNKLEKLEGLLEKSFPVIKVKALRPVVMCILKHLPKIKDEYLQQILENRELYTEASTEVKRQIWQDNQALFGDEVSPLLTLYIKEKETILYSHEESQLTFFLPSPKMRRQGEVVQKLVHMIGRNVKLYDMVLQFLRTLFLRTRNTHYCTLRAELLMALHDLEIHDICSVDPCHKFTWCVDACIRERFVDSKRSRELQGFLDGIKRGQEQVLGDLSMILCDPFAINTVCVSLMRCLQQCINTETMPRENVDIVLLLRMLLLGLQAWDMIDSQVFKEPKLESLLITKYLPLISSMMVDDQYRSLILRTQEEKPTIFTPIQPSELFATFIKISGISSLVAMYYALQVTRQRDRIAAVQIIPALLHCENDRAYEDTFLHSLVSYLISMAEDFTQEDLCIAVFDDFILPSISRESVRRHLLRLLWHVYTKVPNLRIRVIMDAIEPGTEHSEAVHQTYKALAEKVAAFQPSVQDQPEKLDSPLMNVPAPTPGPI